ncbi:serine/threonine-protein kinase [Priestia megaterium]|uniref:serine/threonine-protein kinase n=1 Tax=Priestia megaterium TaxID=1404 RepID=UPI003D97655E
MIQANITFEETNEIRRGPLSRVFLAKDLQLDAEIVVKEIKKTDFSNPDEYFTEARILYSMKHPNIAEIQYACEKDQFIYLSMPYYPAGSLENLYNTSLLSVREIIKYSLDFLKGLHFIHTKGLLHLDVKPGNVLINSSGVAMLTDFGLSKFVNNFDVAEYDKVYQTHRYPESFVTNYASKQSDIYQAGVTLYRMCNGDPLFKKQRATQADIQSGKYPDRDFFLPHIPQSLIKVIKKALNVNPIDRHDSVLELMNELSKIDKNLDWRYNFDTMTGTNVWSVESPTSFKSIQLFNDNGTWKTVGKQTSKSSKQTKNFTQWNSQHNSFSEAEKQIKAFIAQYERQL